MRKLFETRYNFSIGTAKINCPRLVGGHPDFANTPAHAVDDSRFLRPPASLRTFAPLTKPELNHKAIYGTKKKGGTRDAIA